MQGSSLIEVLVALVIFSTTMLGAGFLTISSLKITTESLQLTQSLVQSQAHNHST